jgi:hypothetical protein
LAARLSAASRLVTLDTLGLCTVYFDELPIVLRLGDQRVLLRLISVPGSPMHRPMRRLLLRGADGVVLLRRETAQPAGPGSECPAYGFPAEDGSFDELAGNLRECGMTAALVPVVRQAPPWTQPEDETLIAALGSVLRAAWPAVVQRVTSHGSTSLPDAESMDAALLVAFGMSPAGAARSEREPSPDAASAPRFEAQAVPCGPQSLAMLWRADARSAGRSQTGGASRS